MVPWLVIRNDEGKVVHSKSLRNAEEFESERIRLEEIYAPSDIRLEWFQPGETPK